MFIVLELGDLWLFPGLVSAGFLSLTPVFEYAFFFRDVVVELVLKEEYEKAWLE